MKHEWSSSLSGCREEGTGVPRQAPSSRVDQLFPEVVKDLSQSHGQARCHRLLPNRVGVKGLKVFGLKIFGSDRGAQVAPFSPMSVDMMIVAAEFAVSAAAAAADNCHET